MDKTLKSNLGTLITLGIACFAAGTYKGFCDVQETTGTLEYIIFYAPACLGSYMGGTNLKKSKITSAAYVGTSFFFTTAGYGIGHLSKIFS